MLPTSSNFEREPAGELGFPKRVPFFVTATCTGADHGATAWTHDKTVGMIDVADEVLEEAEAKTISNDVLATHEATGCAEHPRVTVMAGSMRFDF